MAETQELKFPSYLNCAYCPSQAFPERGVVDEKLNLKVYTCSLGHKTYIAPEGK